MLKEEFENMIGKEVDFETYEVYNAMYSSLPENITKQDFVKMLNVDNIPESAESVKRKKEREELIQQYKDEINKYKEYIVQSKNNVERYKVYAQEADDKDEMLYYKRMVRCEKNIIEMYMSKIREIRYIIS